MTKIRQIKFLVRCAHLLAKHGVCNTNSLDEWWKIVKYCHKKGFLYAGFSENEIDMVVIAYRVEDVDDEFIRNNIPEKENGNVLFVLAAVNESDDPWKLFQLFRWYVRDNKNVTDICYNFENSDDQFNILKVRRKNHGKRIKT